MWPYLLLGAIFGCAAHQIYFIKGELHVQSPNILVNHLLLFLGLRFGPLVIYDHPLSKAPILIFYGYLLGSTLSIIIYRLFFHRLTRARIPGPWYSGISNIWNVWFSRDRKYYNHLHDLHKKYGDFVRTGPAEMAVFHPDVFIATDGPRTECIKSEFYDVLLPRASLLTTRDKVLHATRRREWSGGFTPEAVASHMSRILPYIDKLEELIATDARTGCSSDVRNLMYWFGFDAMGELVFSKSFGMLENQQLHFVIQRIQSALSFVGPLIPASWLVQAGLNLMPRVATVRDWYDSLEWCENQMRKRVTDAEGRESVTQQDLTYYLMEEEKSRKKKSGVAAKDWNLAWLGGDSLLAIIAGSDPPTAALIGAFCELGRHPDQAEKVFEEVSQIDNLNDYQRLRKLPHLNAVINETMRLYPALLSAGSRKTTANGITIAGTYIPPHTTIISPRYTISRRADCFENPEEFIPERWTTRPEMTLNRAAFNPWGTGTHSCLGRGLAENIMMCVLARMIKKFRFRLAPGETGKRVMDDMTDQFVPYPGPLNLCFELRVEA